MVQVFTSLVTGHSSALADLFNILPQVIADAKGIELTKKDQEKLSTLFLKRSVVKITPPHPPISLLYVPSMLRRTLPRQPRRVGSTFLRK